MFLLARGQFSRSTETAGLEVNKIGSLEHKGTFLCTSEPLHFIYSTTYQQYSPQFPNRTPSDKEPITMAHKAVALKEEGNK